MFEASKTTQLSLLSYDIYDMYDMLSYSHEG